MTHLDPDRLAALARLVDINAKIADLNSEAESLKAELRALPAGDYDHDGRPALRITPTRSFDVNAAAGILTEEQRKGCLTVTYDAKLVKRHLTPDQVDVFMVESGRPKVVVL